MDQEIIGAIGEEFRGAEIPDWRLRERLVAIAGAVDAAPEASLPKALRTTAAREAAYRFLGNARVTAEAILGPHVRATAARCAAVKRVYVISDTTECSFSGEERGKRLGRLQGQSRGFLAHVALAVSADGSRRPLGVLGLNVLVRADQPKPPRNVYQRKKDDTRESLKWHRLVTQTGRELAPEVEAVHVMDSEADIFELLTELVRTGGRFVIRAGQDRRTAEGLLGEVVEKAAAAVTREVRLSRRSPLAKQTSRRNPPREGRSATLALSSCAVTLRRPKTCSAEYPAQLAINVVRVVETDAPEGEQRVEWILFTSEAIDNAADIAKVVDAYRCRWMIEEYFKALKTGCKYEQRELESLRTLTNLLAIVAVIAWRLLLLRSIQREQSEAPATEVASPELLEALAARLENIGERKRLPSEPSITHLLDGIARLGGHITSNGPPGWQVLWRGYQDLLTWGGGYITRSKSRTCSDQS